MVNIEILKRDDLIKHLIVSGHAEYDHKGKDIVCAAVSTLVITTINSIDRMSNAKMDLYENENNAVIDVKFSNYDREASILLKHLESSLNEISNEYNDYVRITYK